VQQPRVIVPFVEVFENGGEDLGDLLRQVDPLRTRFEELATADGGEEWGCGKDVFVGGEGPLLRSDAERDDGRGQRAGKGQPRPSDGAMLRLPAHRGTGGVGSLGSVDPFRGGSLVPKGSLGLAHRLAGSMLRKALGLIDLSAEHVGTR
jgi:hypothetical protein